MRKQQDRLAASPVDPERRPVYTRASSQANLVTPGQKVCGSLFTEGLRRAAVTRAAACGLAIESAALPPAMPRPA